MRQSQMTGQSPGFTQDHLTTASPHLVFQEGTRRQTMTRKIRTCF